MGNASDDLKFWEGAQDTLAGLVESADNHLSEEVEPAREALVNALTWADRCVGAAGRRVRDEARDLLEDFDPELETELEPADQRRKAVVAYYWSLKHNPNVVDPDLLTPAHVLKALGLDYRSRSLVSKTWKACREGRHPNPNLTGEL